MATTVDYDQALNELDVLLQSDLAAAQNKLAEYEKNVGKLTALQLGRLRMGRSISYIFTGDYAKALEDLNQAESLVSTSELLSSVYSYKSTAYIGMRDYDKALSSISKALALITSIDDISIKRHAYLRIANLYYQMNALNDMGIYAYKVLQL